MITFLKRIFGFGPQLNYTQLVKEGALIVDVRSNSEYAGGHIKGSINIPLTSLNQNLSKLKNKEAVIITCCASGMRSASAKSMLKANGYTSVHNGGGWMNLNRKI